MKTFRKPKRDHFENDSNLLTELKSLRSRIKELKERSSHSIDSKSDSERHNDSETNHYAYSEETGNPEHQYPSQASSGADHNLKAYYRAGSSAQRDSTKEIGSTFAFPEYELQQLEDERQRKLEESGKELKRITRILSSSNPGSKNLNNLNKIGHFSSGLKEPRSSNRFGLSQRLNSGRIGNEFRSNLNSGFKTKRTNVGIYLRDRITSPRTEFKRIGQSRSTLKGARDRELMKVSEHLLSVSPRTRLQAKLAQNSSAKDRFVSLENEIDSIKKTFREMKERITERTSSGASLGDIQQKGERLGREEFERREQRQKDPEDYDSNLKSATEQESEVMIEVGNSQSQERGFGKADTTKFEQSSNSFRNSGTTSRSRTEVKSQQNEEEIRHEAVYNPSLEQHSGYEINETEYDPSKTLYESEDSSIQKTESDRSDQGRSRGNELDSGTEDYSVVSFKKSTQTEIERAVVGLSYNKSVSNLVSLTKFDPNKQNKLQLITQSNQNLNRKENDPFGNFKKKKKRKGVVTQKGKEVIVILSSSSSDSEEGHKFDVGSDKRQGHLKRRIRDLEEEKERIERENIILKSYLYKKKAQRRASGKILSLAKRCSESYNRSVRARINQHLRDKIRFLRAGEVESVK